MLWVLKGPAGPSRCEWLISKTRSVEIGIYKNGHWGTAGSLGQVTHHDRSNSKV
ncbi:MAG TPA: hypothetical protein VEU08_23675 [Vicinamibacterales bacterium]|nr:hypothetical protein [Vicinamibacterales bacterium]